MISQSGCPNANRLNTHWLNTVLVTIIFEHCLQNAVGQIAITTRGWRGQRVDFKGPFTVSVIAVTQAAFLIIQPHLYWAHRYMHHSPALVS